MAYQDFIEMMATRTGKTPEALLSQEPLSFPVSTNIRGQAMVDALRATVKLKLDGLRVLDVGCAYGGFSLALAQAGAKVTGVDINPTLLRYAEANARDVAEIPFIKADASGVRIRSLFSRGSFDLIVLNDVLEHIYDTASLFENLDYLLSDRGVVYFKVPNALSPRWALNEGHRNIFALSLMDPDTWQFLYPHRASIFYRPLAHFQGLFHWFRLPYITFIDQEGALERMDGERLRSEVAQVTRAAKTYAYPNDQAAKYIRKCVTSFRDRFRTDRAERTDDYMRFVYGAYFFVGFASRKKLKFFSKARKIEGVGPVIPRDLPVTAKADL